MKTTLRILAALGGLTAANGLNAATNYYYIGGVEPTGLGTRGTHYEWTNANIAAVYDDIMDRHDGAIPWMIRMAAGHAENLAATLAVDGKMTGGAASASQVAAFEGGRLWTASTPSHAAVTADHRNKSVLSGDTDGDGDYDCRVLEITVPVTLDGFRITKGRSPSGGYAGGVHVIEARVTLRHLEIHDNQGGNLTSDNHGMGISILGSGASDSILSDLYVHDNLRQNGNNHGAGIYLKDANRVILRRSKITGHSATTGGGIIFTRASGSYVVHCEIKGNLVSLSTGGLAVGGGSPAPTVVANALVAGNGARPNFTPAYLAGRCDGLSTHAASYWANVTFADNTDDTPGPGNSGMGIWMGQVGPDAGFRSSLVNCLFANTGTILNMSDTNNQGWIMHTLHDTPLPAYSPGHVRTGNIEGSAQFAPGSYRLRAGSVGIDHGAPLREETRSGIAFRYVDTNGNAAYDQNVDVIVWHEDGFAAVPPGTGGAFDLLALTALGVFDADGIYTEGESRVAGDRIDIGAYEWPLPVGTVILVK